ncbi:ribosome silencing factor [Rickettsiella grylli]|uniref:Ribosomal silencing factor RsfS n=1 Tax=Rickettsiella grylli TaxID=59196 RepID=A8PLD1_9COXI|nr:ribosome silencing factor [Rickettsiella grylli]EDP46014.1 putative iojap homolog [Rickettsiella grylli]OIZ97943.1 ribosome silencing factor [Rickettsiella grylli]
MTQPILKKELQTDLVRLLADHKAKNITVLNVSQLTDITDHLIICTGNSNRHVKTLAQYLITAAKAKNMTIYGLEGEKEGEWILIDLVDVVVHIMLPQEREFYNLEKLWGTVNKT